MAELAGPGVGENQIVGALDLREKLPGVADAELDARRAGAHPVSEPRRGQTGAGADLEQAPSRFGVRPAADRQWFASWSNSTMVVR